MIISDSDFSLPGSEPDVLIMTNVYNFRLHSHVLRLCSRWYARSISDPCWESKTNTNYKYCYKLAIDGDVMVTLVPATETDLIDSAAKLDPFREIDPVELGFHCTLERMFKSFYRQSLDKMTFEECTSLVSLADRFDAMQSVRDGICASLFEWNTLEPEIESNPLQFLYVGYKLQSTRIFTESFIHVVGTHCGKPNGAITTSWGNDSVIPVPVVNAIKSECNRINQMFFNAMRQSIHVNGYEEENNGNRLINQSIRGEVSKWFKVYGSEGQEGLLFRAISGSTFLPREEDASQFEQSFRGSFHEAVLRCAADVVNAALVLCENNLRLKQEMPYLTCAKPPKIPEFSWL